MSTATQHLVGGRAMRRASGNQRQMLWDAWPYLPQRDELEENAFTAFTGLAGAIIQRGRIAVRITLISSVSSQPNASTDYFDLIASMTPNLTIAVTAIFQKGNLGGSPTQENTATAGTGTVWRSPQLRSRYGAVSTTKGRYGVQCRGFYVKPVLFLDDVHEQAMCY